MLEPIIAQLQQTMYQQVLATLEGLLAQSGRRLNGEAAGDSALAPFAGLMAAAIAARGSAADVASLDGQLNGVLAGLSQRYGLDPALVRAALQGALGDGSLRGFSSPPALLSGPATLGASLAWLSPSRQDEAPTGPIPASFDRLLQLPADAAVAAYRAALGVGSLPGRYAPGTDRRPWDAVDPPLKAVPGRPDRALYEAVIAQFDVERNPRYAQNQTGSGDTYCNIFVWDVTRAMGVEIPHWVDRSGDPAPSGAGRELDANGVSRWLEEHGARYGWRVVDERQAQELANQGYPVVVAWENASGRGHVGMIRPGDYSARDGPMVAQAGAINSSAIRLSQGFWSGWKAGELSFYVHDGGAGFPGGPVVA